MTHPGDQNILIRGRGIVCEYKNFRVMGRVGRKEIPNETPGN